MTHLTVLISQCGLPLKSDVQHKIVSSMRYVEPRDTPFYYNFDPYFFRVKLSDLLWTIALACEYRNIYWIEFRWLHHGKNSKYRNHPEPKIHRRLLPTLECVIYQQIYRWWQGTTTHRDTTRPFWEYHQTPYFRLVLRERVACILESWWWSSECLVDRMALGLFCKK